MVAAAVGQGAIQVSPPLVQACISLAASPAWYQVVTEAVTPVCETSFLQAPSAPACGHMSDATPPPFVQSEFAEAIPAAVVLLA